MCGQCHVRISGSDGILICMCKICGFPWRIHCTQCNHDSESFRPRRIVNLDLTRREGLTITEQERRKLLRR